MKKTLGVLFFNLIIRSFCFAEGGYNSIDFQEISDAIDDAIFGIRYYLSNNFTGKRVRGCNAPVAYLTKKALVALKVAANELRKQGCKLLI